VRTVNVACSKQESGRSPAPDGFLVLAPIIERHADVVFRHLPASDREECRAEAVAAGLQSYRSLIRRGKDPFAFPSLMATRAVQHVQAGRLVGGRRNTRDVLGKVTRHRRGFAVQSLDRTITDGEADWYDAVVDNTQTPPDEAAAFRCDFPAWLRTLSDRNRRIVGLLALGHAGKWVARQIGISPTRLCQLRQKLREQWNRFHGELYAGIA
jgi:hypothetical protein